MTVRGRGSRRTAATALLTVTLGLASGCTGDDSSRLCGAIDRDRVDAIINDADYTATGDLTKEKQPGGPECTVADSDQTFLTTSYYRVLDEADHAKLESSLLESRDTLASKCPDLREISDWAVGNACFTDGGVDLTALTENAQIRLKIQNPATKLTLEQAEAIARDVAAAVPDEPPAG